MKRLLCIVNSVNTGGAETFLMKLYRAVDRAQYQFDFCINERAPGFYEDEIQALGGKVIRICGRTESLLGSMKMLYRVVRDGDYNYVMRIGQYSLTVIDLVVAKAAGANRTIYRSANSSVGNSVKKRILHKCLLWLPKTIPDVKIAPSQLAAEFMFGKRAVHNGKVLLLNNAIDTDLFKFNADVRRQMRKSLGLEEEFAVCHIGRFSTQKNHYYLIDVFAELHRKKVNAILFLIGKGELEEEIKEYVDKLGLSNCVCFMGVRSDIPQFLMAMDVMLFPSLYEGMPNTIIEAQATGLHCVISDSITREAAITNKVDYMSLAASPEEWAEKMLAYADPYDRENMQRVLMEKGYDIGDAAKKFCDVVFENN